MLGTVSLFRRRIDRYKLIYSLCRCTSHTNKYYVSVGFLIKQYIDILANVISDYLEIALELTLHSKNRFTNIRILLSNLSMGAFRQWLSELYEFEVDCNENTSVDKPPGRFSWNCTQWHASCIVLHTVFEKWKAHIR